MPKFDRRSPESCMSLQDAEITGIEATAGTQRCASVQSKSGQENRQAVVALTK
ncbi:hypothetical protein [Bradyrhizobium brasilense]|uniref:hypothetical protein n=1 Tax=Bradyrhizobium brasilense TaxID=1419277 RepID=UPI001E4B8D05|nr:hypothetical protein [Bradyrhizobium brasilense]MCC8976435.1 hypothetical protein [Bradyrhizobium brasilense]